MASHRRRPLTSNVRRHKHHAQASRVKSSIPVAALNDQKQTMPKTAIIYAIVVFVTAMLGFSLTRTHSLRSSDPLLFAIGGALIAATALLIFHKARSRIELSLPPARQLRGLKLFTIGFLVALIGWFAAVFVKPEIGVNIALLGFAIGFAGMFYHFYLQRTKSDA